MQVMDCQGDGQGHQTYQRGGTVQVRPLLNYRPEALPTRIRHETQPTPTMTVPTKRTRSPKIVWT